MKQSISTGKTLNAKMHQLRASAEMASSNYFGNVIDQGEFLQNPARAAMSSMDGHAGASLSGMQPIIINITNTDEVNDLTVPIFGKNEGFAIPFNGIADLNGVIAGTGKGIILSPENFSVNELKEKTNNPFTIQGIRYHYGDSTQLKKGFLLRQKIGSSIVNEPYNPSVYKNLNNQVSDTLDHEGFFMPVSNASTLFITVAKAFSSSSPRTIQIVLFVGMEANIAATLKGESVVKGYQGRV